MSRRLVHLAACAALVLTASACQKPSPGITLVSGSSTTHFEAQQWCRGGQVLQTGDECPGTGPSRIQLVRADEGGQVGIDVDPVIADEGWYVYDADTGQIELGISTDHYRTFPADFSRAKVAGVQQLEVRTIDHVPTSSTDIPKVTGQWVFQVVAKV
ncbi:MAG: hypothetical protein JWO22_305 [Frankiales bacterium]|nr:hypothetical protein [Frankiales bacterium]